jgi:hypothetical protein
LLFKPEYNKERRSFAEFPPLLSHFRTKAVLEAATVASVCYVRNHPRAHCENIC